MREALRGPRDVRRLWIAGGPSYEAVVRSFERAAAEGSRRTMPPGVRTDDRHLAELAGSDEHQGVVAEVGPYRYADPDALLAAAELILVLDRVQDPHNLGAVVRTAEEAGAAVVIPRHRAVAVTPAVVRASAGATEHALVAQVRNLSDFLAVARHAGYWVYGAEAGSGISYVTPDYRGKVVLVLGSEGAGLAPRVRAGCDQLVFIPLAGKVGSLNVSVAAGVLLFEVQRQRAVAGAARDGTRVDSGSAPGSPEGS